MTRYGTITGGNVSKQADNDLVYLDTGLVEGSIVYALDADDWASAVALLGTTHPDDSNVTLYRLRRMNGRNNMIFAAFDCIGINADPTDRIVSFPTTTSTEPIETHPDFEDVLAGTPDAPLNEAQFDPETGAFLGWMEGSPAQLRGVQSYYTGSVVCRATYFTRKPPRFHQVGKIVNNLPGIPDIAGVTNWLYLAPSSEQIANAQLWRVTEEYLGSGGAGWSALIYG